MNLLLLDSSAEDSLDSSAGDSVVYPHAFEFHPDTLEQATKALLDQQHHQGYWCYELEPSCTMSSEYILLMHFMGQLDTALEQKIANYLRQQQSPEGGWSLYYGGDIDISCTVKAYFSLKLTGDSEHATHMVQARNVILEHGGAANVNVFTLIQLAYFEQIPWHAVPFMPVEIMLLPKWFPFHIRKVAYWSRVVMVPLFILCTLKPRAANVRNIHIRELFTVPPEQERHYMRARSWLNRVFLVLDRCGRLLEKLVPAFVRRLALRRAVNFISTRLNGDHGIGGIFPAIAASHQVFSVLGYDRQHPYRRSTSEAINSLLVVKKDIAYCQPCVSPVWDTGLSCLVLQEATGNCCHPKVLRALDWLKDRQLLDEPGDWQWQKPHLRGGGWAFEFRNDHYPDIDDTPLIAMTMLATGQSRYHYAIERAAEWIVGMQSSSGGWGSFDANNTYYYLNEIPFADHGALLDPPTSDVTARCVCFLARFDRMRFADAIDRGLVYLGLNQASDGSWYGRWGTNYIYGTWSVLTALVATGLGTESPMVATAVQWLRSIQHADGGWGEDNGSYYDPPLVSDCRYSTAFQTAWALLGLMELGYGAEDQTVRNGVDFLLKTQNADGQWSDPNFTAPGFPRVFYLKYHGYNRYFPLWALARYRRLQFQT